MNVYDKVYEKYKNKFRDNDLVEYLSTWDYDDEDFKKLAQELNNCIEKNKTYKQLYVPFWKKIFNGLFLKIYYHFIDE